MQSLLVQNGDLVIGPSGYATVTGPARVKQDLKIALGERYGTDPYHPAWGSLLPTYVGRWLAPDQTLAVQQEVLRVVNNYLLVQRAMIQSDALQSNASRFSFADVISSVEKIQVSPSPGRPDRLDVQISVLIGGQSTTITTEV